MNGAKFEISDCLYVCLSITFLGSKVSRKNCLYTHLSFLKVFREGLGRIGQSVKKIEGPGEGMKRGSEAKTKRKP